MNRFLLFFLIFFVNNLFAQTDYTLYERGKRLFREGKYCYAKDTLELFKKNLHNVQKLPSDIEEWLNMAKEKCNIEKSILYPSQRTDRNKILQDKLIEDYKKMEKEKNSLQLKIDEMELEKERLIEEVKEKDTQTEQQINRLECEISKVKSEIANKDCAVLELNRMIHLLENIIQIQQKNNLSPLGIKQYQSKRTFESVRGSIWVVGEVGGLVSGITYGIKWNTAYKNYQKEPYLDKKAEFKADTEKYKERFWISLGVLAGSYGLNVLDNWFWTRPAKQNGQTLYLTPNYNGICLTLNF